MDGATRVYLWVGELEGAHPACPPAPSVPASLACLLPENDPSPDDLPSPACARRRFRCGRRPRRLLCRSGALGLAVAGSHLHPSWNTMPCNRSGCCVANVIGHWQAASSRDRGQIGLAASCRLTRRTTCLPCLAVGGAQPACGASCGPLSLRAGRVGRNRPRETVLEKTPLVSYVRSETLPLREVPLPPVPERRLWAGR